MTELQKNHIDLALLVAVLMLMALSVGVVYSASASWAYYKFGDSNYLLNSHAVKIFLGVIALFVGMGIKYTAYQRFTKYVLLGAVALLVLTLATGGEIRGASRWLRVGSFGFQPSELAKFALLFHLAALIATKGEAVRDFKRGFIPLMIWIAGVTLLVLLQPNFSTGTMIFLLSLMMLFVGRVRFSHIVLTLVAMIPLLAFYMVSAEYRMKRLLSFLGGESVGTRSNYQLWQGIIGFGNGGLFGVGPGESKQRDFFLPESYGDFVFSIVGEEYGFIGTILFLALFGIIMIRGFKIAKHARDDFGYFLAVAVTCTIILYATVNAGVTLGVLPTTGLPMPFVSYGGSSIFFSAYAVGVLLNISAYTDLHPRPAKVPVVGVVDASGREFETAEEPVVGRVY